MRHHYRQIISWRLGERFEDLRFGARGHTSLESQERPVIYSGAPCSCTNQHSRLVWTRITHCDSRNPRRQSARIRYPGEEEAGDRFAARRIRECGMCLDGNWAEGGSASLRIMRHTTEATHRLRK